MCSECGSSLVWRWPDGHRRCQMCGADFHVGADADWNGDGMNDDNEDDEGYYCDYDDEDY